MGAQRAAWASSFQAEYAVSSGQHHAIALLDLVKAFERIPHAHLWAHAQHHGFNLRVLSLSLSAYKLARRIGISGVYSSSLWATRGITAGSTFATIELRVLLTSVIQRASHLWAQVHLSL